jgi:hypothetical protein
MSTPQGHETITPTPNGGEFDIYTEIDKILTNDL